jgi:hypothetical protein
MATARTELLCPLRVNRSAPVCKSQTLRVISFEQKPPVAVGGDGDCLYPVAMSLRVNRSAPVCKSQTLRVLSLKQNHLFAVGGDGDCLYPVAMSSEGESFGSSVQIPDFESFIV